MRLGLLAAGALLSAASGQAEDAYYRIELVPSGSLVSVGAPLTRGTTVLFHGYPNGNLMSLRRSDLRSVARISPEEASAPAHKPVVAIGSLAMQGGSSSPAAPARPVSATNAAPAPRWNGYDSWAVVPGAADAPPLASAVQTSPGAPPTLPH
ncbi:MAG TPA: hypothetical protein VN032_06825 [Thermoanaerobaculia bacterium]|jgi:hypothetical protein|nr:hypothetical protein [Thermoanaerobaculia bacterium]